MTCSIAKDNIYTIYWTLKSGPDINIAHPLCFLGIIGILSSIFVLVPVFFNVSIIRLKPILKSWIVFFNFDQSSGFAFITHVIVILKVYLLNFIYPFLCIFLKLIEFFNEIYDFICKFCVMWLIFKIPNLGYFYRSEKFYWKDTGLKVQQSWYIWNDKWQCEFLYLVTSLIWSEHIWT